MDRQAPEGLAEVIIVPLLCAVFAAVIWLAAWNRERMYGQVPKWRWFALLPLILGAFVGWGYFQPLIDPEMSALYVPSLPFMGRRRIIFASYAAFLGPILMAIVLGIWAFLQKKRSGQDRY